MFWSNCPNSKDNLMGHRLRLILWIPALAYVGFLLSGGRDFAALGEIVTMAFLGALLGFLLAAMFTIRQHRRERYLQFTR